MSRVMDVLAQKDLYSVEPGQNVTDVARHMAELHVGAILVMENGELKGIFSERDFLVRVVVERRDPNQTTVGDVMTCNVATIDETATIEDAMESMRIHTCRAIFQKSWPASRASIKVWISAWRRLSRAIPPSARYWKKEPCRRSPGKKKIESHATRIARDCTGRPSFCVRGSGRAANLVPSRPVGFLRRSHQRRTHYARLLHRFPS